MIMFIFLFINFLTKKSLINEIQTVLFVSEKQQFVVFNNILLTKFIRYLCFYD